jgi:hypothetical protein
VVLAFSSFFSSFLLSAVLSSFLSAVGASAGAVGPAVELLAEPVELVELVDPVVIAPDELLVGVDVPVSELGDVGCGKLTLTVDTNTGATGAVTVVVMVLMILTVLLIAC